MTVNTLGYIGEKVALELRRGAALGPYPATLTRGGDPVSLAGCTIPWVIRKTYSSPDVIASGAFEITGDGAAGEFIVFISAEDTALVTAGVTPQAQASQAIWQADVVDADDERQPLYYGPVSTLWDISAPDPAP